MSTPEQFSTVTGRSRRGHRLWIPIGVGCLAAAAIVALQVRPELEQNFKGWMTWIVVLVSMALGLLWFLFLSRIRWWVRLVTIAALALVVFGLSRTLRVDGTSDGRGLPRFAWKWSARPEVALARPVPNAPALPRSEVVAMVDVPQFFGPNRDGIVTGARLARDWSATPPKELWRQPIGAGWSAYAVVGGRAYTQEQRGEEECVTCYEVLSGRVHWTHANRARFYQWQGGEGPRATPTVDRGLVFAYGATGILNCLNAATGDVVWSRDVFQENGIQNLIWGASASPLVFEDSVVVTGGLTDGPTVLAYDRTTGEPRWTGGKDKASYASPVLVRLGGKRVILSFNAATLTAHDVATGAVLLDHRWGSDNWPKAAQPVILGDDRILLSAGYGMGCELFQVKPEADGRMAVNSIWKNMRLKTQFNSVALRDGYLYGLDDGLLACVEFATGERRWKDGRYGAGQTLLVDDLLLIQSEPGDVVLAEAKPDAFRELGRIPALSSKTWNHPTLAGRYLLVRNDREAACYELPLDGGGGTTQVQAAFPPVGGSVQ